ncbi:MAG: response regulator [Woronichinia naegeliana WA131]|jgi:twitching motility two-component system response regulator PilH|uniref:Response regulator n=1 Tax=Woronichinia naegeliana WA131 TaxID=2824559 RepID=A0A977PXE9_9CYAN|nr:MAG: response regulator [Woronichinia naegeliana WA131]
MKRILVVEDSKSEQLLISGLLKPLGEVVAFDNGEAALVWLEENPSPDLIFLDIVMPDISGYDLCRRIRNKLENVPIVFCSTKSEDYDKFWALRQGGNAYVTKPYSPSDLVKTAKDYLTK